MFMRHWCWTRTPAIAADRAMSFVLPTPSEKVPAPRPERESAGRTVVAAPCQGAAHRFWRRGGVACVSGR
jgi:hypothetical protein